MDLKDIVSITGKSGLYLVKAKTPKGIVVESIDENKRKFMVSSNFQVAFLEEITVFSRADDDLYLGDIFSKIKEVDGKETRIGPKASSRDLMEYFREIAPDHDEERVYPSDVKKIIKWYNLLNKRGMLKESEQKDKKDAGNQAKGGEKKDSSS